MIAKGDFVMFSHDIMSDMAVFYSNLRTRQDIDPDRICQKIYDNIEVSLNEAENFYVDMGEAPFSAFDQYFKYNPRWPVFENDFNQFIKLPYKICCFLFSSGKHHENGKAIKKEKSAVLVEQINDNTIEAACYHHFHKQNMWLLTPILHIFSVTSPISENPFMLDLLTNAYPSTADDHLDQNWIPIIFNHEIFDFFSHDQWRFLYSNLFIALEQTLILLNCKNTEIQTHHPNEKINKKRQRSGKPLLMKYKTLYLELPSYRKASSFRETTSQNKNRYHACRGHYKAFTREKPLFGKLQGMYWWKDQFRGNKSIGEISKEYLISVE